MLTQPAGIGQKRTLSRAGSTNFLDFELIKFLKVDTNEDVPCPDAHNPMLSQLRGLETIGGSCLVGMFPEISLILTDGHESPPGLVDYFKVGLLNIVSSKLKDVLQSINAEVEYFPVMVFYYHEQLSHYFVANPLKRFDAVDLNASDVEIDEELGDALSVLHLVLDESKFFGTRLAVVSEIQQIAVSDDVCEAVVAAGCIGCAFVDPATMRY
jgi:hypothetical protein